MFVISEMVHGLILSVTASHLSLNLVLTAKATLYHMLTSIDKHVKDVLICYKGVCSGQNHQRLVQTCSLGDKSM